MASAKRLPSGSWRVRKYARTDENGKKIYVSFTAPTREEAELKAAQFANSVDRVVASDITVKEAVQLYIDDNEADLSPSTVDGYLKDLKSMQSIHHMNIRKLNSHILKMWVNEMNAKGLAPKTVRNRYGLLKKALKYNHIDVNQFDVKLPSVKKYQSYAPEMDDIARLYNAASRKMKIALNLAARHSLRRGEIAAIKYGDIDGNKLYVHSDIVKDKNGTWIHKDTPKTEDSNRTIYLSEEEMRLIGRGFPDQYVLALVPSSIGTNFHNLKHKLGLGHIRLHDMRVFFASFSASQGNIPEVYTAKQGGWKEGSKAMHQHYIKPIRSLEEEYANRLNEKMDEVLGVAENRMNTEFKEGV